MSTVRVATDSSKVVVEGKEVNISIGHAYRLVLWLDAEGGSRVVVVRNGGDAMIDLSLSSLLRRWKSWRFDDYPLAMPATPRVYVDGRALRRWRTIVCSVSGRTIWIHRRGQEIQVSICSHVLAVFTRHTAYIALPRGFRTVM